MAKFYDTLLAEYVKNPWVRGLAIDKLSEKYFDYEMIHYNDLTQKWKISFSEVDLDKAAAYSWEDVFITSRLERKQSEAPQWAEILSAFEIPLLEVLKDIEIYWVKIDREKLESTGEKLSTKIKNLEKEIHAIAWENFNINSPKQVGEILFWKLELPKWKKTKTWWSVSANVLENLAGEYPIASLIVNYRHYSKLLSTYIVWLTELLDKDNLLHTNYNQAVASTWRLSSTNPNLQNIPAGDGISSEIRAAFISRHENGKIMAFDYSQVEIRILALLSEDKNLINIFNSGWDMHNETAKFIFWDIEINSEKRKIAKAVNFWVIYGISGFWLSKSIDISVTEWNEYIKRFYEKYPEVRSFFDLTIENAEKNGYVETLFWRKRYIPAINDRNKMLKSAAEREAINMPIQWTSADIIKLAMIQTQEFLNANNTKSRMIMQVHDELVFDVYPAEEEILKKGIIDIMENILDTSKISLKVDVWEWISWKECK